MTSPHGGERPTFGFIEQSRNKQLARELNGITVGLRKNVLFLADKHPTEFDHLGSREDGETGILSIATVNGINEVNVGFEHSLKGRQRNYRKVGVRMPDIVSVNLYTDRETFDQVQKLYAYDWEERFGISLEEVKEQVADVFTADDVDDMTFPGAVVGDDLYTYYFTDREGNFAKVIGMPKEIAGDRRDLLIEGHPIGDTVSVQVPMMARDFVLLRTCLDVLNEDVDEALQSVK